MLKEMIKTPGKLKQQMQSKQLLYVILTAAVSFILTEANVNGAPIPAAAALCAALSPLYSAAVLTGGLAGYITSGNLAAHITDIVAMAVVSAFGSITSKWNLIRGKTLKTAFSGGVYIVSGLVIAVAMSQAAEAVNEPETAGGIFIFAAVIFRGILCSAGTALFLSAKNGLLKPSLSLFDKASAAAVFALFVNSLCAFDIMGVNIGRTASIFAVIISAFALGSSFAMPVFALTLIGQALLTPSNLGVYFIIAAAALVLSLFRYSGKLPAAVAFTIVSLAAVIVTGFPDNSLYIFVEIFIALIAFLLLPERFYSVFLKRINAENMRSFESAKTERFGDIFSRIVEKTERAAAVLNNLPLYGKNKNGAMSGITSLRLTADIYSDGLRQKITNIDADISKLIAGLLSSIPAVTSVCAGTDNNDVFFAQVFSSSELSGDMKERIKSSLSVTGRTFEDTPYSERFRKNKGFIYIFSQSPNLVIEHGLYESPAEEDVSGGYSGDSFEYFTDGMGNDCFIISDGMGSGARAAVESAMAVSLISELIKGGVEPVKALRFVNFTLEEKSNDETTTTCDLLIINRYTGLCTLSKLGAARTTAILSGEIKEFEGTALPAGIIIDNEPDFFTFNVQSGDKIALFSDGIMAFAKMEEILKEENVPPELAAKIIGEEDPDFEDDYSRSDDKTIAFIAIT
jgi:serine/threonine protein phosphatase PrpC